MPGKRREGWCLRCVSRKDAWQRDFGYACLFDDLTPAMLSIIDCEPFYFTYGGKDWMIELWKGQYGLETGCEIGIYKRSGQPSPAEQAMYDGWDAANRASARVRRGTADGRWFECAGPDEELELSFILFKNGEELFRRGPETHWWLTGFKWGELSEPEELRMDLRITLANPGMREAFRAAVKAAGYPDVRVDGNAVSFTFDKPRCPQPDWRRGSCTDLVRSANEQIHEAYASIKRDLALERNDPNLFQDVLFTEEPNKTRYETLVHVLESGDSMLRNVQALGEQGKLAATAAQRAREELNRQMRVRVAWASAGYEADKNKWPWDRVHTLVWWEAQYLGASALVKLTDGSLGSVAQGVIQSMLDLLPRQVAEAIQTINRQGILFEVVDIQVTPDCTRSSMGRVTISVSGKFAGKTFPPVQIPVNLAASGGVLDAVANGLATKVFE